MESHFQSLFIASRNSGDVVIASKNASKPVSLGVVIVVLFFKFFSVPLEHLHSTIYGCTLHDEALFLEDERLLE